MTEETAKVCVICTPGTADSTKNFDKYAFGSSGCILASNLSAISILSKREWRLKYSETSFFELDCSFESLQEFKTNPASCREKFVAEHMEKYRKFADPATSCNPFLPIHLVSPLSSDTVSQFLCIFFNCLLAPLKLAVFVLAGILLLVQDGLSRIPVISLLLVQPIIRSLVCWLLLASIGIYAPFVVSSEDFRRLQVKRPDGKHKPRVATLSTYHGFIDILVYAVTSRPSCFVFRSLDNGNIVCFTVIGAILTALKTPLISHSGSKSVDLPRNALVFMSPSPTNGLGILKLDSAGLDFPLVPSFVQVSSIQYSCSGYFYPHHLTETFGSHLLKVAMSNWFCTVRVKVLPEAIEVKLPDDLSKVRTLMSRLSSPPAVETNIEPKTYIEFQNYWKETQSLTYGNRKFS